MEVILHDRELEVDGGPRPDRVLFARNDGRVADAHFAAAIEAAYEGLSEAVELARRDGRGPAEGEYVGIKVIDSPAR